MKKSAVLLALLALSLQCASIDFIEAPKHKERVMPHSDEAIFSYHDVLKNTTDAIVHIATTHKTGDTPMQQMHPLFEQFFGPQFHRKQAPKRNSLGSGVIISKDGYIITNNHVIDKADEIVVTIPGSEKEYEGKVIGSDPKSDIAVIKIDAKELNPIRIGHSSDLKVGDVVFAIGNPFGVGQSVTQGIISAQHKNSVGINEYENYIQTDASINPGNSGGALVDSRGALIGINTAIITRSGGNQGIGFAIEVDMVKNIARKLIENGLIERGYLGVSIGNLTKELRNLYAGKDGCMLLEVHPDTSAEKAGLKRGDLILEIDGERIGNAAELKNKIGLYQPDSSIEITYERNRKTYTANVTLGNVNDSAHGVSSNLIEGLELAALDEKARRNYRIPSGVEGILIINVKPQSDAAEQGLQKGDIIVQVEEYILENMKDLSTALDKYTGVYKRVYISRNGQIYVIALK